MNVERIAISELVEDPANARTHGQKNLDAIRGSLKKFKQQKPIVVDKNNVVVAGNGTLAVARALGWEHIWAVRTELAGAEATAFAIVDNRTAELAAWDNEVLGKTLSALDDDGWNLPDLGFDAADLAKLFEEPKPKPAAKAPPQEWLVVIECADEAEQMEVYEGLQQEGRRCKIM